MTIFRMLLCCFLFPHTLFGQHTVKHENVVWANYNNSIAIDSTWSLVNDLQIRTKDGIDKWSLFALRTGAVYKLNKHVSVAAGLAWFGTMNYFTDKTVLANEWRPWQEVSFRNNLRSVKITQRFRLEQRFLQKLFEGKRTNYFETLHRLRYRTEVARPIWNKKLVLIAGDEVMANLNYIKDNRFFDQNRAFVAADYKLSASTVFQFQYIRLVQWRAASKILEDNNVFRCSIHLRF